MTKTHLFKDAALGGILRENIEIDGNLYATDIIQVDGKRYRMVNRKANVGEKVIITKGHPTLVYKDVGEIVEILATISGTFDGMIKPHDFGEKGAVYHFQYRVLEPIEPSDSQLDIIARLTRKVAQLERENTDIKRDIERLKRKLDDARYDIEMVIDDIVTLDERTQPEELAKKLVEVITKGLNAIDPRHFG
jgi:hypothetical protein